MRVGAEAVAKQCRAIEELRNRAGSPKRLETAHSTEALQARIETLCKADVEASYRSSAGEGSEHFLIPLKKFNGAYSTRPECL